jgi:hypothetical protein
MRHTRGLPVALALLACSGGKPSDRAAPDTTNMVSEAPAPTAADSTLHVTVSSLGKVFVDGRAVTQRQLDSLLTRLKAMEGEAWYYREPRDPSLTAQQDSAVDSVLAAFTRHDVSVRVAHNPDFSDLAGKHRLARPDQP